jgi:enamine deaminase RidA (YjgF/YER057c/UK114 family)
LDYRSSFSRAAEIVTPEWRTVFVSGTASIEPGGLTVHHDDMDKQVALTMDVVKAILETRGMTLKDSVRAIAYIKRPEDRPKSARDVLHSLRGIKIFKRPPQVGDKAQ